MVTSRGAFFLGLSLIICVAMLIYGPQIGKFRYLTIPTTQGLFILDTKTQMMNVCTDKNCRIVPHETSGGLIPGMQLTYGQMQRASMNSLGTIENDNNMTGFGYGNSVCMMPSVVGPSQQAIQMQQPKPIQPVVVEEKERPITPVPEIQEMMAPRPVAPQFVARPPTPPVIAPMPIVRSAPQIQPQAQPQQVPSQMMAQQRPVPFQSAIRTVPTEQSNPAEAAVLADERNLSAAEQAVGLGR